MIKQREIINKNIFKIIADHVIAIEGGYVDDPADRGGETKYGISKRQYPEVDIKSLTREDALQIYYTDYFLKYRCDELYPAAAALLFDAVVNHNPVVAVRMLQRAAGAKTDGIIGPKTITAVNNKPPIALIERNLAERARLYTLICVNDKSQTRFIRGWHRRLFNLNHFILK